jgi:hypothetical protein
VTLTGALDLLRTQWATETERLIADEYSFWLGSGISRERYPDLAALMLRLLRTLQSAADHFNPNCPYTRALRTIVSLTTVADTIDLNTPLDDWPDLTRETAISQLINRYSDVLDVELRVAGPAQELFWDVLKLQELYGDRSVQPDAEHKFLALLALEGVVSELVSANWDPLIELAAQASNPRANSRISVVVRSEDIAGSTSTGTRLVKVHGCAAKALEDPGGFREFLVITRTHISRWDKSELRLPFRELVGTILREKYAVFIGLSGQDQDLQEACLSASLGRTPFPLEPSRILFASPRIDSPQHAILKAIYGPQYSEHPDEIDTRSALPLYAKPLLGSLYLLALEKKINALIREAPTDFGSLERFLVEQLTNRIETFLRQRYDAITDNKLRWRQLATEVGSSISRFLRMYRYQDAPSAPDVYEPLSPDNPSKMIGGRVNLERGLIWMLLALALFVEGETRHLWAFDLGTAGGENGHFKLEIGSRKVKVFLASNSVTGLSKLLRQGFVDPDSRDCLVVYPSEMQPIKASRHTPARTFGRRVVDGLEFWVRDIIEDGQTLDELMKEFEKKVA